MITARGYRKRLAESLRATILGSLGWCCWAASLVAGEVALDGHVFQLADGLAIERVAGPPLVLRPICADFDEQGTLYVADSSGSNETVQVQLETRPHRIMRLLDTDGDGRFDDSTVFADRMMFPEGVLYHDGSVYVAAPPSIWKLTDTDGDGVADRREEWFEGKTLTGCANDLHGPYLGRDGWIYWCKGAFASQTYERPGKPAWETRAAHIFRRHPRTGEIEPVMTGGMDNPVEVVFTAGGERIFTTTFLQHPGGGRRDGLIHAVYGGVYGKVHDVIQGHVRTGDVMPVLTHLGPAAPCGLAYLESDGLGTGYRHNVLATLFNMHKVTRHRLIPEGATYRTEDQDLLVSDNVDFHPTDVVEDADGSLLIVDTGGWYKICCPTSHLHKPDVLGAIYRVRRTEAPRAADPRGLQLRWSEFTPGELAGRLADERPVVRRRAQQSLVARGEAAVASLADAVARDERADVRLTAVWTLAQIDDQAARVAVRRALADKEEVVRQAAAHVAGVWRDRAARDALCQRIRADQPPVQRAAAEALGRLGDPVAVPTLLEAAAQTDDRVLEHSLIYALIEIHDLAAVQQGLAHASPRVQRAALIALDQTDRQRLEPTAVAALLSRGEPLTRATAVWLIDQHPEWARQIASVLRERLIVPQLDAEQQAELEQLLARLGADVAIQQLCAGLVADPGLLLDRRQTVLRAMAKGDVKEVPAAWSAALAGVLQSDDEILIATVMETLTDWRRRGATAPELREPLIAAARNHRFPDEVRLSALAASGELAGLDDELFAFLRSQLTPAQTAEHRLRAVDVAVAAGLQPEQLVLLVDHFPDLGPMELGRLLPAYSQLTDDKLGIRLIAALETAPAAQGVPVSVLRTSLERFGPEVQQRVAALCARLDIDVEAQRAYLDELFTTLDEGDVRRGQAVFYGRKAACSTCHAIGYLGGNIGPDLTRIAGIRTARDLLEAVVFPSASFVRSYEPVTIVADDGRIYSGTIRNEGPEQIELALAADKFVTIPRASIEEIQPSKTSIMPAGLDKQLTRQEVADLLAFLKACK